MIQIGQMTITGFGAYDRAVLDWSRRGLHLIMGENRDSTSASSNGTGKSTLALALYWALYGQLVDDDPRGVVHVGAHKAVVEVNFTKGGSTYLVRRELTASGKSKLSLEQDGHSISGKGIKQTQAALEEKLGISADTFRNTVFFGQSDVTRFASPKVGDAARKELLSGILNLDKVERALTAARTGRDRINAELQLQQRTLDKVRGEIQGLTFGVDQAKAAVKSAKSKTDVVATKRVSKRDIEDAAKQVEADNANLLAINKEIDEVGGKLDRAKRSMDGAVGRITRAKVELGRAEAFIQNFDKGECPTCGEPASAKRITRLIATQKDALAAWTKEIAEAEEQRRLAKESRDKLMTQAETCAKIRRRIIEESIQAQRVLARLQEEFNFVERQRDSHKKAVAEAKVNLTTQLDNLKAAKQRRKQLKKQVAEYEVKLKHYEYWVKGFGHQGISNYVIDSVIPRMTQLANDYLSILTDGDITVVFDTQTQLKGGEARDRLSIKLNIEGSGDTRASGGQKRKVEIATSLALMDLLRSCSPEGADILIMDEVLDGLDEVGQARVVDLLMRLREKIPTIWVISHAPKIADVFESVTTVIKDGGTARIKKRKKKEAA